MRRQLLFKQAQDFFILVYIDFYLSNRPADIGDTCASKHLGNLVAAMPIPTATDDLIIALAVNDMLSYSIIRTCFILMTYVNFLNIDYKLVLGK